MTTDFGLKSLGRREGEPNNSESTNNVAPATVIDFIAPKYTKIVDSSAALEEPDENEKVFVTLKRTIEVEKVGVFKMNKSEKKETLRIPILNLMNIGLAIVEEKNNISNSGKLWIEQRATERFQRLSKVDTYLNSFFESLPSTDNPSA